MFNQNLLDGIFLKNLFVFSCFIFSLTLFSQKGKVGETISKKQKQQSKIL